MAMQDHAKKQVREFLGLIKPFRKAWHSFDIRVGAVTVGKSEFCVIFSGTLDVLPPDQILASSHNPSVKKFRADQIVLPFSGFDKFIEDLYVDHLRISERTILFGKPQQNGTVREGLSPSPHFERAGEMRRG